MKDVNTGFLRSAPDCLSPAWKHVFKVSVYPIGLIMGLRDKLLTDSHNPVPQLMLGSLHSYNELISKARDELLATLAILDVVTPKTWNLGHAILKAVSPVFTALGYLPALANDKSSITAAEREKYVADTRMRILEACKNFNERPLLEELRNAVSEERGIELSIKGPADGVWPIELSESSGDARIAESATTAQADEFEDVRDGHELKPPSADAVAAYRLFMLQGKKQTEIAEALTAEWGRPVNQGSVSRWLRQVEAWIMLGNVLPPIESKSAMPLTMDPTQIELGKRKDLLTKRQRDKKTEE